MSLTAPVCKLPVIYSNYRLYIAESILTHLTTALIWSGHESLYCYGSVAHTLRLQAVN